MYRREKYENNALGLIKYFLMDLFLFNHPYILISVTDKLYQFVDFFGRVLIFIPEVILSHLNLEY